MARALTLLLLVLSTQAHAVLAPNLVGDRVDSLPRGRFMASAVQFFSGIESRFTPHGGREHLKDNFNRTLSWHDITAEDADRTAEMSGLLRSQGVDLDAPAGRFRGSFNGRMQTLVPVLGAGITDRIGIFAALPVVKFQGESRVAYVASPSAAGLVESLQANQMTAAAKEFATALNHGFEDQLKHYGYRYEQSEDRTMVGDLMLVMPIAVSEPSARLRWALQPSLSIPTGRVAATDDLYRISTGNGSWTPGFKAIADWRAWGPLSAAVSAGTQVALPHHRAVRVPRSSMDELIRDVDDNAYYGPGLQYGAQLDLKWRLSRSWQLRTGAQHQHALARAVSGTRFDGRRYALLSDDTAEQLTTGHVALELNSLQAFLDGDFLFPSQLSVAAALPLAGANALADPLYMVQVALFF